MIEAYRVGCSLVMDSGIGHQLEAIIAQFERLDGILKSATGGAKGLSGIVRGFGGLDRVMSAAAASTDRMSRATADMGRAMPDVTRQAQATADAMERAASASRGFVLQGAPYTPPNYQLVGQPYTPAGTAVRLYQPPTGGPPAPYTPWGSYAGYPGPHTGYAAGGPVTPYTGGPGGIVPPIALPWPAKPPLYSHDLPLATAGYGIAGRALTGFTGDVLQAGMNFGHELYTLRATSPDWTDADMQKAAGIAMQSQRDILGVTPGGAVDAMRDIFTITRNKNDAMSLAPDLLRMSVVLSAVGRGGEVQQLFQAMQAGELRGAINSPEEFTKFLRNVEATTITTGGRIGPAAILKFLQNSGVAGRVATDPDLFGFLIPTMLSMNPGRAGTALQGMYRQFGAGKMSDAAFNLLSEMGLIADPAKAEKIAIGYHRLLPGGMRGEELLHQGREAEFMRDVLLPAIQQYNLQHYGHDDIGLEATTGLALASTVTGAKELSDFFSLLPLAEKYHNAIGQNGMRDAFSLRVQQDPLLRMQGLQAAWTGFLTSLASSPVMDAATKVLRDMTDGLNAVGKWAQDHPNTAKLLVEIAGALGTLAVAAAAASATIWLAGPMARVARYGAVAGRNAAVIGAAGRPGLVGPGLVGLAATGGAIVTEATGGPDWLTNMFLGASMGSAVGAAFGGVGAVPGAIAGGVGGLLWNAHVPYLSDHDVAGNRLSAAPIEDTRPINLSGTVNLDGKKVGTVAASSIASEAELPSAGPTSPDMRITIPQPGYMP